MKIFKKRACVFLFREYETDTWKLLWLSVARAHRIMNELNESQVGYDDKICVLMQYAYHVLRRYAIRSIYQIHVIRICLWLCVCDTLIYGKRNEKKSLRFSAHMQAFTSEFVRFHFEIGRRRMPDWRSAKRKKITSKTPESRSMYRTYTYTCIVCIENCTTKMCMFPYLQAHTLYATNRAMKYSLYE